MTADRGDIFDLGNFKPEAKTRPVSKEEIRRTSEEMAFTSREAVKPAPAAAQPTPPPPSPVAPVQTIKRISRRARTGRNRQLNIKMTEATADRMAALADAHGLVYGELIDQALDAFEREAASR